MPFIDTPYCRRCGCSELAACLHADGRPCWWVEVDLCSRCAEGTGMNFYEWTLALLRDCRCCEFVPDERGVRWLSRGCSAADYWSPGLAPEAHAHCRWYRWLARPEPALEP